MGVQEKAVQVSHRPSTTFKICSLNGWMDLISEHQFKKSPIFMLNLTNQNPLKRFKVELNQSESFEKIENLPLFQKKKTFVRRKNEKIQNIFSKNLKTNNLEIAINSLN